MQFPWLKTTSYGFAALEELGNLNSLDVEKVYVHSLDNDKTGGEFLVHDERLGKRFHVKSTFPQVTIMPPHVLKCISSAFKARRPIWAGQYPFGYVWYLHSFGGLQYPLHNIRRQLTLESWMMLLLHRLLPLPYGIGSLSY